MTAKTPFVIAVSCNPEHSEGEAKQSRFLKTFAIGSHYTLLKRNYAIGMSVPRAGDDCVMNLMNRFLRHCKKGTRETETVL